MPVKLIVRLVGLGLLAGGGYMGYKAYTHSQSIVSKISEAVGNSPPRTFYELLIPAIIMGVVGLGLLIMPIKN